MNAAETVSFDILLKPPATAADANTVSIDTTRPAPEDVERCRRWLIGRGVEAHDSGFGLACTANRQLFEEIFF